MPAKLEVKANYKDMLEQIRKKSEGGLSKEEAREMIDDLQASLIKKLDKPIRKGHYEYNEFYDQGNPSSMVELHKSAAYEEKAHIKMAQSLMDDAYFLSVLMKCDARQTKPYRDLQQLISKSELGKAMDTATSGGGAEWVPTEVSRYFVDMVDLDFRLAQEGIFPRIPMPRSPMQFYRKTGHVTAYKGSEGIAPASSKITTANSTLAAESVKAYVPFTEEFEMESIIALLPSIKEDVQHATKAAIETAIINGDTSGTHMDSDITAAADACKLWKGLRKSTLTASKVDLSTFNYQTVLRVKQKLGKYGSPGECFWTVGVLLATKLLNLQDQNNNPCVVTMDKLGPKATILTGMLGNLAGSPIIESEEARENLNASGVYDGSTDDKALLLYTRKNGYCIGDRAAIIVETDKNITTGITDLVSTRRLIFEDRIVDTEPTTAYGYNIDPIV